MGSLRLRFGASMFLIVAQEEAEIKNIFGLAQCINVVLLTVLMGWGVLFIIKLQVVLYCQRYLNKKWIQM